MITLYGLNLSKVQYAPWAKERIEGYSMAVKAADSLMRLDSISRANAAPRSPSDHSHPIVVDRSPEPLDTSHADFAEDSTAACTYWEFVLLESKYHLEAIGYYVLLGDTDNAGARHDSLGAFGAKGRSSVYLERRARFNEKSFKVGIAVDLSASLYPAGSDARVWQNGRAFEVMTSNSRWDAFLGTLAGGALGGGLAILANSPSGNGILSRLTTYRFPGGGEIERQKTGRELEKLFSTLKRKK